MTKSKSKSTAAPEKMAQAVAEQLNRPLVSPEERYRMIAEAAYYRAEKRGFAGGDTAEDWREAEAEIDRYLQQNEETITMNNHEIQQQVQAALESEPAAIADKVRAITLQALSSGELDYETLKQVISTVVASAHQGVEGTQYGAQTLKEAMRGLDDALASAAEATQLAIQEAIGRSDEFSRHALKKTADDLAALEALFIETVADGAKNTAGLIQDTLRDLAEHARTSGTSVGRRVEPTLTQLNHALADTIHEQVETGAEVLRKESALLASLAAGMLKGIADRLQPLSENKAANSPSAKGRDR